MTNQPSIVISSIDAERIENLLETIPAEEFPHQEALENELTRATIIEPQNIPPTVVTMNSTVRVQLGDSGEEKELKLVYPGTFIPGTECVSILAPVGCALLGLSEGDKMQWARPGGGSVQVTVKKVIDQPERTRFYTL
ncbi:nucleoside diphosphate kinase regulator [Oleidesulfovibrio sp.]|uniref:nucleoside diphosphate kinase regulator n=1 Tax=Oleidesulfovibrio sp. TaxID=2909707 RepID=UPI003A83661C